MVCTTATMEIYDAIPPKRDVKSNAARLAAVAAPAVENAIDGAHKKTCIAP